MRRGPGVHGHGARLGLWRPRIRFVADPVARLPRSLRQPRRIRVDGPNNHLADIAVLKSGSVLPSLTAESGMLVQPARLATECEFDRFGKGPRHRKGSDLDPITWEQCYALNKLSFPLTHHSPCE